MTTNTKIPSSLATLYSADNYLNEINNEIASWQKENKVKKLWDGDTSLWTSTDENKWEGWLDIAENKTSLPQIKMLSQEIIDMGITDVVVLGMGGSSLFPALLSETFGKIKNYPQLHVLDSTDPEQIHDLENQINLEKSFFIVSSKSGTTLEPNIFHEYFYSRLQTVLNKKNVGDHFIAITDKNTKLETLAKEQEFKAVFNGVSSIGGRYSALSNFGIVPMGLMGLNVDTFLNNVSTMHEACSPFVSVEQNPGILLGIVLGVCGRNGKDKITLITSPDIHAFGAWLEQLLAESTGKIGKGFIPVDNEPLGNPNVYGDDRIFAYIRLNENPDLHQDRAVNELEQAGYVVIRLNVSDKMHLGAEVFRWEIATAAAGSILHINPFNQPDVEESKVLALQLTSQYERTKQLSSLPSFFSKDGITLFADEKYSQSLSAAIKQPSIENYLRAHFQMANKNDYVNLSAFIAMSDEHLKLLQESRVLIRDQTKLATCLGFGPRFLHSTGQAYKGGPNTGVFLQITSEHANDIAVPQHQFTFGLVITAQAQADFTVLVKRGRRVLRLHLENESVESLKMLREKIKNALM